MTSMSISCLANADELRGFFGFVSLDGTSAGVDLESDIVDVAGM